MHTIRFRVFLLITISILLVSLVISSLVILKSKQTFNELAVESVRESVENYALNFNKQLNDVKSIAIKTEIVAKNLLEIENIDQKGYLDGIEEEIEPFIYSLANEGNVTKSSYIFFDSDIDGHSHDVWYTDLENDGNLKRQEEFSLSFYENMGDGDEWFLEPKRTLEPYWTNPYHGSVDYDRHVIYISYTRPLVIDNRFIGVVGSDYHFSTMLREINKIKLYDKSYAVLLNERGEVIIHPTEPIGSSLISSHDGRYQDITLEVINNERGYIVYDWLNDEEKFLVYETLENGWKFAVAVEKDSVFLWYQDLQWILMLMTLVIFVFELIIGYFVSRRITRPMDRLVEHVGELSLGKYDSKLPIELLEMKDETGTLSKSVESMRFNIKETMNEITNHLKRLEKLVGERSFSLVENHKQLEAALKENYLQTQELELMNAKLENVFSEMQHTQKQLIESEKIASMNSVMTRIAYEIFTPMDNFEKIYRQLNRLRINLCEKMNSSKMTKRDLIESLLVFEENYLALLDNLNKMSSLVESFKALDPYTEAMISKFEMSELVHMVIDSISFPNHIGVEVLCSEPVIVHQDASKMSSILHHLLENAALHAFEGLDSGLVVVDIFKKENKVHLVIKDNGIGISNEVIENVMKPIYHTEHMSGYGLMISYNLVVQFFNGTIDYMTDKNFGTEFRISIALDGKV